MEGKRIDPAKLRYFRELRKLKQKDIGIAAGVVHTQVSRWEAGELEIPLRHLPALVSILGVEPSEILAPAEPRPALTRNGKPVEVPGPVTVHPAEAAHMPLRGVVPGGPLHPAIELEVEPWPVAPDLVRMFPDAFLLQVSGESMAPMINDGDLVVVKPEVVWGQGITVIAEIDGEVTLKRIGEVDGKQALVPYNDGHHAIILTAEQRPMIRGIVVAVVPKWRVIPH
jgi:DNA polymerase V